MVVNMSKQASKNQGTYYLGLDIGTNSVGWAITNTEYELLQANKKDLWGVRLFDTANTAADRRLNRSARRRHMRKVQRLHLLQEIFEDKINQKDPDFFKRLRESAYHKDDKSHGSVASLFADSSLKDMDFHNTFHTFFHLRSALIKNDSKAIADVRFVYLAIHHILKNRGHFLFAGDTLDTDASLESSLTDIVDSLQAVGYELGWGSSTPDELGKIFKIKFKNDKRKLLNEIFTLDESEENEVEREPKKVKAEIIKALVGSPFTLATLFQNELYAESDVNKVEFDKEDYDVTSAKIEDLLEADEYRLIQGFEAIFNWVRLSDILGGHTFLSDAKIESYDEHRTDLSNLKAVIKKYCDRPTYYKAFKDPTEKDNYAHYIGTGSAKGKKVQIKASSKCSQEDVNKYFDKIVAAIEGPEDEKLDQLKERLALRQALPKQRSRDNRTIPQQLHRQELVEILKNAESAHPFLTVADEDGYTPSEKILSMMTFRIPYYVGPLNTYHMEKEGKEGFAWMVRQEGQEETRILPWNWERVVDKQASSEKFITRMTNTCTYLFDEPVLPKNSLLYTKYMVLNELNNIRINGELISVELKQQLYNDLFLHSAGKNVTLAALKKYLVVNNIIDKGDKDTVGGIDQSFTTTLKSYVDFYSSYLQPEILSEEDVEHIILWKAHYVDDEVILREKIVRELGSKINEEQVVDILRIVRSYKGWARLSRKLLTEIYHVDPRTTEAISIIKMMWDHNLNLMELLSERFSYLSFVEEHNRALLTDKTFTYDALVKPLSVSPSVKRQIWQTLLIVRELKKVQGRSPEKIFIEMAREQGPKQKTRSRKEQLKELYHACKNDIQFNSKLLEDLERESDANLRSDKLYFYYTQMGKCLYSGQAIDLNNLADYDIDHIYPQSVIKDDSLNNRVLVHKTYNGLKGDNYPINSDWQANMQPLWSILEKRELITKTKYERLIRKTRLTDDEISDFINRQLVETRQSTKHVANILQDYFEDTELVYVKARNVSAFRDDFEIKKSRSVNDHHHAHDAYLNIVVGNAYDTKFTKDPRNFVKGWRDGKFQFNAAKLFAFSISRAGYTAWEADPKYEKNKGVGKALKSESGTILKVRETLRNPRVLVTRQTIERGGELFNLQPVRKKDGIIPLKNAGSPLADTSKYGGYESANTAHFALVEYLLKKDKVRKLVPVPVLFSKKFRSNPESFVTYCEQKLNLSNPSVLLSRILINETIVVNKYPMSLRGVTGNQIIAATEVQLILDEKHYDYVCQLEKFNSIILRVSGKEETINSELLAKDLGLSKSLNTELYDIFVEKEKSSIYSRRPANQADFLMKKREDFQLLGFKEQCELLIQILNLFKSSPENANLSALQGGAGAGSVKFNSVFKDSEAKLIHRSPTGLFTKVTKIYEV